MAVGENNHNLLAITSTYHIFNTLKRPLTDICQFWGTATLFSLVKVHQKVRKIGQNRPNVCIIRAKKGTILKKYTTAGVGVDN